MLGRLFGRSKEDNDETICATCGRTLLAGEWTQRLVDDDGRERYVCSLCSGPAQPVDEAGTPAPEVAEVGNGRVKPARSDSDVFWRAIKDKDVEIERLESLLARSEAEKQELAAQLAGLRAERAAAATPSPAESEPAAGMPGGDEAAPGGGEAAPAAWVDDVGQTLDVPPGAFTQADDNGAAAAAARSDIGADTVEIPPDELEQVLAGDAAAEDEALGLAAAAAAPAIEHTDPRLGEALRASQGQEQQPDAEAGLQSDQPGEARPGAAFEAPIVSGFEAADAQPEFDAAPAAQSSLGDDADARDIVIVRPGDESADASGAGGTPGFERSDDDLVPLTVLQRGVDLLNVSAVPRRIVETNESLGVPQVHVGSRSDSVLLVTFMWTMGWYQFCVELADGGRITLAERGYDQRDDLRPNASVRADGTVQLAPTQIKPPTPRDSDGVKPPGVTSGVIISKSMMGQRTDDENVPNDWKTQRAPDFDWGR